MWIKKQTVVALHKNNSIDDKVTLLYKVRRWQGMILQAPFGALDFESSAFTKFRHTVNHI
jgi:hypothetical protein